MNRFNSAIGMGAHLGNALYEGTGINSKIDLKIRLLVLSGQYGMDFESVLSKFKDEYEALPLTADESRRNALDDVIPKIADIAGSIFDGLSDTTDESPCAGCKCTRGEPSGGEPQTASEGEPQTTSGAEPTPESPTVL